MNKDLEGGMGRTRRERKGGGSSFWKKETYQEVRHYVTKWTSFRTLLPSPASNARARG